MKTKSFIILVCLGLSVACKSHDHAVNADMDSYVMPGTSAVQSTNELIPSPNSINEDAMRRSPNTALEGVVYLNSEIPVPVSRAQIALYRKNDDRWKEITRWTTETNGGFRITQKLPAGDYQLRILDARYRGTMDLTLDRPTRGIIFNVSKK